MSGDVGMEAFITSLTTGLSSDAMWGALTPLAPLIIAVVLFALALYFTRKVTKGAAKGKARF